MDQRILYKFDDYIAGWFGGICGLVVGHPLDTVKVRQQTMGNNMFVTTARTFRFEGIRGFYRGMLFPLLTIGPSNAVFFGIYGNSMKHLHKTDSHTHLVSYDNKLSMQQVFIAGCFAGFFQVIFTCPVERIKTVLQAHTEGGSWKKHYIAPYTGSIDAIRGIFRESGIKGVFRGLNIMMWRDVPTSGIYTLTYELLMYSNFAKCDTPKIVKQMVAGGTAGILSWLLVIPVDVVKSRIQCDNPENPLYRGTIDCFVKTYKQGGWRIFFRGLPATLVRAFPVNASIFIGYEAIISIFEQHRL